MRHSKQNWFVGIRTPWTLSSEKVWNQTHKVGGTLFKIAGAAAIIGILFGKYSLWFVVVPLIVIAVFSIVYSYILYQREKKH